ncbi:MAG: zinc ribbon domain-containing protein, partial [Planctomycetota bacterium]
LMTSQISEGRKTRYYFGLALMIIGALLFFSNFVVIALNFGDFSDFKASSQNFMLRAFGGMGLLIVGGILRSVGSRGLAGSGVLLNPARARDELEPYSRMAGSMVKDALEAADVKLGAAPQRVTMLKCRACGKLNDEDSKFCQECGKPM